jgi:hypothetical protein
MIIAFFIRLLLLVVVCVRFSRDAGGGPSSPPARFEHELPLAPLAKVRLQPFDQLRAFPFVVSLSNHEQESIACQPRTP